MESMDIVAQNVENIGNLFPDCITEARDENGKIQKVVDRDRLMQKVRIGIIQKISILKGTILKYSNYCKIVILIR